MSSPPAIGLMTGDQVERFAAGAPTEWDGVRGQWRMVTLLRGRIPREPLYSFGPSPTQRGDRFRLALYTVGDSDGLDALELPQIPDEGVPMVAMVQVEPVIDG